MKKLYDFYGDFLTAEELREGYQTITGLDNDDEMTDDEVYAYMLEACED